MYKYIEFNRELKKLGNLSDGETNCSCAFGNLSKCTTTIGLTVNQVPQLIRSKLEELEIGIKIETI